MARANRKSVVSVSLFPFLNILACVMGTLTLIIYGVALGQTAPQSEAELAQVLYRQYQDLAAQIEALENRLTAERQEVDHLGDRIDAARKDPGTVMVVSAGRTTGMIPTFVECGAETLTIHPSTRTPFDDLVETLKGQDNRSIVFLIRPFGVEQFEEAQEIVKEADIKYGYVPLPATGRIDLSLWGIDGAHVNQSEE